LTGEGKETPAETPPIKLKLKLKLLVNSSQLSSFVQPVQHVPLIVTVAWRWRSEDVKVKLKVRKRGGC
jgi:hypothetical protein